MTTTGNPLAPYEMQGWTYTIEPLDQVSAWGPDLPDVNRDGKFIDGALALDIESVTGSLFTKAEQIDAANDETHTRIVVAMAIANQLHEIAEWLRRDGRRVFACHVEESEFDVIASIAWQAAGRMLAEHPRHHGD